MDELQINGVGSPLIRLVLFYSQGFPQVWPHNASDSTKYREST